MSDTPSIGEPLRAPRLAAAILMLLMLLFAALGWWQLGRAEQRAVAEQQWQTRAQQPPLELAGTEPAAEVTGRRVVVSGRLLPEHAVRIEHRKWQGRSGTHLLVPLQLAPERTVGVVMGWLPRGDAVDLSASAITVTAVAAEPRRPALRLGSDRPWGERWPWADPDRLQARTGGKVADYLLFADPPWPGLQSAVPQLRSKAGMHEGYAIQWFAFALIALVAAVAAWRKRT